MSLKKPFVVAEISANHNGKLKNALRLIDDAKKYGADAIKIQTFSEDSMTINSKKKYFKIKSGLWKGYTYWDLYKKAKTPFSWHKKIFDYAHKKKILCFSTPFDTTAVEILEKLNCPIYKVASFEITDLNLIKRVAQTKKPIIISTGLSNLKEIEEAFKTAKKYGSKDITLLYCVSNYPSKIEDFNLKNIQILKKKFKCKVGFSDHSTDNKVAILAYSLGAELFEKHIALKYQKKGFDIKFSLKGNEIKKYISDLKSASILIGSNKFLRKKNEIKNLIYRRSIYAIKNINKGEKFTKENLKTLRPSLGLDAKFFIKVLGKTSSKKIKYGTPIKKSHLILN